MAKYHISIIILHWVAALIVTATIIAGFYMTSLPNSDQFKWSIYGTHMSFGLIILGLTLLRIISRLRYKAPDLPEKISRVEQFIAFTFHKLLYLSLLIMPVSGFLMDQFLGFNVIFFGKTLPNIVDKNLEYGRTASYIHHNYPYILIVLLFLHIAGSLKHLFIDKINVFKRII